MKHRRDVGDLFSARNIGLAEQMNTFRRRIGILTMPMIGGQKSFISESTVRWFADRGVDVVEIPFDTTAKQCAQYMRRIHGLYLHGGPEYNPVYMATAKRFLELAMQANQRGTYFPVWGTCHGFQTMMMVFGGMALDGTELASFDALHAHMTSLQISPSARRTSRMLRGMDRDFIKHLTRERHILFANEHGITPQMFYSCRALVSQFRLIATACDAHGKTMVAAVEARKFPFYGTQFHPEVVATLEPLRAFFVRELMKNTMHLPLPSKVKTERAFRQRHTARACTQRPSRIYRNSFVDTRCYFF